MKYIIDFEDHDHYENAVYVVVEDATHQSAPKKVRCGLKCLHFLPQFHCRYDEVCANSVKFHLFLQTITPKTMKSLMIPNQSSRITSHSNKNVSNSFHNFYNDIP